MRLDLKINDFHHFLIQRAWFSVENERNVVYIDCSHTDGIDVVCVTFESAIPSELYWSSFKVPKPHLTEKELENYVLDWLLTDAGSYCVKKAFEELIKQYSEI